MARTSICSDCRGTGLVVEGIPGSGTVCPSCMGSGTRVTDPSGAIGDLLALFANLHPTCKVAGCIDGTEFLALAEVNKGYVNVVLSVGFVDMRDGQWARTTLFAMFGAQSVTRAALIAMFG